ncbi:hypothetical protein P4B35_13525 [Pontiellaceae bacterium B12227]|nr:hypothetical protein [Pontiellaceae bacterium B12227]
MKKLFSILTLLFFAAVSGIAQDTIVLKNGDTLSGKILKQSPEHIFFKSAAFGSISLSPRDISEIRISTEQLGEISVPAEAIPKAEGTSGNLPKVAAKKPPKAANKKAPPKKSAWSGQAGLAIAMREKTSSNQNGVYKDEEYETYKVYGNVNWKGERNNLRWAWTYRYSEDEYRIRDDFFNVTQNYKHSFRNDNLFASAKTLYQRDYNRRIENEYLQTAELGIKWFGKDSKLKLSTSAGGGYHSYERLDRTRTTTTSVSEPKFIFDESFRWDIINTLALTQKYTHLGDLENYHFIFSAGVENKLVRDLFVRLEYRLDRDTEVFYDDKGYYDKALLTSLLYKF